MAKNPYEWIYERQAQPLKSYVLDETAKMLAQAAREFPPVIESWEREDVRARFEPLLRSGARPGADVLRVALALYRWELDRDVLAIDDYMRNDRWRDAGLDAAGYELAVFLWQYWTEQTLAFKDYVGDRFRWPELAGLGERLTKLLLPEG